jgi:hypothetical protein
MIVWCREEVAMDMLFHQTGLLVAAAQAESSRVRPEEEGMGHLVLLPTLRDRLMLRAGQLMIAAGEKLTAIGMKDIQLTQDLA